MAATRRSGSVKPWVGPLALLEIVGIIVFTVAVGILAALDPSYSHLAQPISALGEIGAPFANVQSINFIVFGAILVAFAFGLHQGMPPGSILGPGLVALAGIGVLGAGFFPCAPGCEFSPTLESTTHSIASGIFFLGFLPVPFLLSRRMAKDEAWNDLARPFIVLGILIVVLNLAIIPAVGTPVWGAVQRVLVGTIFISLVLLAVRLYRTAGT